MPQFNTLSPDYKKYRENSLSNTPQTIKDNEGNIYAFKLENSNESTVYFKFYNKVSPSVSTDTPQTVFRIPGNSTYVQEVNGYVQEHFSEAISVLAVTGRADTDNNAPENAVGIEVKYG